MAKPIGIQLYTLRDMAKEDFVQVLKTVADIGYKGVEFAGFHGKSPAELRKVLDDLGLVACSTHGPLVTKDNAAEQVDYARTLGYDVIIAGVHGEEWNSPEGIKAVASRFQAAAEALEGTGVRMGYHNHWWEMNDFNGTLGYEIFLDNAPGVVGELDVYWAANFGKVSVTDLLKRRGKRFPLLHIKDGPLVEKAQHLAVGAGKMDIPACVAAADMNTVKWMIVEIDSTPGDMLTAVRESYTYLTSQGLAEGNK